MNCKKIVAVMLTFSRAYMCLLSLSLTEWGHRFLQHCCWISTRRYISIIFVYNLPRLRSSSVDRSNERKWFYAKKKKGKKLTSPHKDNDRRWQCRWHGVSCKYIYPSRIPAATGCCILTSDPAKLSKCTCVDNGCIQSRNIRIL